jgi:hypothetical protein
VGREGVQGEGQGGKGGRGKRLGSGGEGMGPPQAAVGKGEEARERGGGDVAFTSLPPRRLLFPGGTAAPGIFGASCLSSWLWRWWVYACTV